MKLPLLKISQLECNAAEAALLSLPRSLDGLCRAVNSKVQKDMAGKKIMQKLAKYRKPTKKDPKTEHDSPEDIAKLISYNRDDVLAEESSGAKLLPLTPFELSLFRLTIEINERGMHVDQVALNIAIDFFKRFELEETKRLQALTNGQVTTARSTPQMHAFLESQNFSMPDFQAQTVEDYLAKDTTPALVKQVLQVRQFLAKSSTAKLFTLKNSICNDGRVRGYLKYAGANTRRWTAQGFQPHNFKRPDKDAACELIMEVLKQGDYEYFKLMFPDVNKALSNILRMILCARPGYTFFDVDWAAIEARVVLYFAGDAQGLEDYRNGVDQYKKLACLIYNVGLDAVTDYMRTVGKHFELGSGYGMGADKGKVQCLQKFGIGIPLIISEKGVKGYRKRHPQVPLLWKALEEAATQAVVNRGVIYDVGVILKRMAHDKGIPCDPPKTHIKFKCEKNVLVCLLPSGGKLYYPRPFVKYEHKTITWIEDGKERSARVYGPTLRYYSYKGDNAVRESTYGGKLCENVCSSFSRDIMAHTMLRLNREFPVVLTVHDEVLCEVKKENLEEKKKRFLEIANAPIPFCDGLPLKVGFWQKECFGKWS